MKQESKGKPLFLEQNQTQKSKATKDIKKIIHLLPNVQSLASSPQVPYYAHLSPMNSSLSTVAGTQEYQRKE